MLVFRVLLTGFCMILFSGNLFKFSRMKIMKNTHEMIYYGVYAIIYLIFAYNMF